MNITSGRLHAGNLPLAYYIFLLRRKCYRIRISYCIVALSIVYMEFKLHLIDRRDSAHNNQANANNEASDNADTANQAIHDSTSRFLPPGFRTRTPWKMLLSSVAYLFIIWLCLSLELENTYGAKLWLERIFCLGMFIFAIFCGFNYLNVQNILPLCKSKNRFLHYVGIILLDVAVIFALFVIMFIIESVAFPIK